MAQVNFKNWMMRCLILWWLVVYTASIAYASDYVVSVHSSYNYPYAKMAWYMKPSWGVGVSYQHQWVDHWITGYSFDAFPIRPTAEGIEYLQLIPGTLMHVNLIQQVNLPLPLWKINIVSGFSAMIIFSIQDHKDILVRHEQLPPEAGVSIYTGLERNIFANWDVQLRAHGSRGLKTSRYFYFSYQLGLSGDF